MVVSRPSGLFTVTPVVGSLMAYYRVKTLLAHGDTSQINQLGNANTDWFGLVDRTAFGQDHNFAVSGTGGSNRYRLSLGYLNQDGIIQGTSTQRISLGFNYDQRVLNDRLSVRTNLKGSRSFDQFPPDRRNDEPQNYSDESRSGLHRKSYDRDSCRARQPIRRLTPSSASGA